MLKNNTCDRCLLLGSTIRSGEAVSGEETTVLGDTAVADETLVVDVVLAETFVTATHDDKTKYHIKFLPFLSYQQQHSRASSQSDTDVACRQRRSRASSQSNTDVRFLGPMYFHCLVLERDIMRPC